MAPTSAAEASAVLMRQAACETLKILESSTEWDQLVVAEGVFHHGDDPLVVDKEAQDAFSASAKSHQFYSDLQIREIVGEEHIVDVPPLSPGERLIVLDPLDGSKPWFMIRSGYCVAALMLLAGPRGGLAVESAIIATPTHSFTLLGGHDLRFGRTFALPGLDAALLSAVPEDARQPPSLACVSWKASERIRAAKMIERLPGWSYLTLGGNPITPFVVAGGLTASIAIKPSSTWDAVGILMATATDAVVGDLDGTIVSGPTFRDLFGAVLLEGRVTAIPPMIVAKNYARYQEVALAATAMPPE
jgi:hypothetical protein